MSIDTLAPGSGRGRGCGRGAPFGNNEQRRELRYGIQLNTYMSRLIPCHSLYRVSQKKLCHVVGFVHNMAQFFLGHLVVVCRCAVQWNL